MSSSEGADYDNNNRPTMSTALGPTATQVAASQRSLPSSFPSIIASAARDRLRNVENNVAASHSSFPPSFPSIIASAARDRLRSSVENNNDAQNSNSNSIGDLNCCMIRRSKNNVNISNMIDNLAKYSNDPDSIQHLKFYGLANQYFNDFTSFLHALSSCKNNNTNIIPSIGSRKSRKKKNIQSMEFSWRFMRHLSTTQRVLLLQTIGSSLPELQELALEAIGPCTALTSFLRGARSSNSKLQSLRVGALRVSNNNDIVMLSNELGQNETIQFISMSRIRMQVCGTYRMDEFGEVWFVRQQQQQQQDEDGELERLDEQNKDGIQKEKSILCLDPLFFALSKMKSVRTIQFQFLTDFTHRIENDSIRALMLNNCLTKLTLYDCNLDDSHCVTIAKVLNSMSRHQHIYQTDQQTYCCTSLKHLNLMNNPMITYHMGYKAICEALETSYTLEELNMDHTDESPEEDKCNYRELIALYLHLNRAGRGRLLNNINHTYTSHEGQIQKRDWVEFLIVERDFLDALFYIFQANPLICV